MDVTVEQQGDVSVVSVTGSIDALTSDQLTQAFEEQIGAGQVSLVADFTGVDYTSSAGLRALLGAMKSSRSGGGDLRLAQAGVRIRAWVRNLRTALRGQGVCGLGAIEDAAAPR